MGRQTEFLRVTVAQNCAWGALILALLGPRVAAAETQGDSGTTGEGGQNDGSLGHTPEDYINYNELPAEVPANGTVVFKADCLGECEMSMGSMDVEVVDPTGTAVPGELVPGDAMEDATGKASVWFTWKPETALTEGVEYSVVTQSGVRPLFHRGTTFVAVEPSPETRAAHEVLTLSKAVRLEWEGRSHCCEESDPAATDVSAQCSHIATSAKERIDVYLYSRTQPNQHSQFAYYARTVDGPSEKVWSPVPEWILSYPVGEAYCYEIYSLHLATGTEALMASGCEDNELIEFPYVPASVETHNAGAFENCIVPPRGQKERWCKTFQEAIVDGSCEGFPAAPCAAALQECPGYGAHEGSAGAGGASADTSDPDPESTDEVGCSTRPGGGARDQGGAPWTLVAAGLWVVARRHASRHERQRA